MTTRDEIVAEARKYLGVRWVHQGRSMLGLDCIGLPIVIAQAFDIVGEIEHDYPRLPDGTFVKSFTDMAEMVNPMSAMQPGDILLFAERSHMCHCGILTDYRNEPGVIQAAAAYRKVIETPLQNMPAVFGRPRFVFKFPGLED